METLDQEVLELIRAIREIASEEEPLFASADDCSYFRSLYRSLPSPQPILSSAKTHGIDACQPPPKETPKPILKQPDPPKSIKKAESLPAIPLPEKSTPPRVLDRFDDLRSLFSKIAPQIQILDHIPPDTSAKQISERWKTRNQAAPISLLFYQELPQHRLLLEHLAEALNVVFGGARLIQCASIEKEKQWEAFLSVPGLKNVLICDAALWQLPNLLQFYREVPSHSERFLHNIPVFLLPDLSLYLKDPLLKRSLWKALCQKIA